MAGGGGTRFWPLSRAKKPKQFLNVTGKDILVNETFDRLSLVADAGDIFVVTNQKFEELTYSMMEGRIRREHILGEPAARNTAACIGYAAMEILQKYGDGVLCVVPSDHAIGREELFAETLQNAAKLASEKDCLVTVGIEPTYPSTGYGYIKCAQEDRRGEDGIPCYKVLEFMEKPDKETAKAYLASGEYSWNSGMFVFKASVVLKYFEALLPDIYRCLLTIGEAMNTENEQKVLEEVYPVIPKISIDYGIMERAEEIYMFRGTFGWNDVGSLNELEILQAKDENGNICFGQHALVDASDSVFYAKNRLIAAVGVHNIIVVETEDAVLVCPKEKAQDVKKIVEYLESEKMDKYL